MSTTMTASLVNGFASSISENISEVQEYEKILRLRDEIFAGTHPRLTVPAHAIRKVSPLSVSSTSVPPPLPASAQQTQLPGLSMNMGVEKQLNIEQNVNNNSTSTQMKPTTTSGIDPVLLMKSDELVKAETQLHRQRLEKALRDQFEQKRLDARKKPAAGEAKPDFDVAGVLTKAQEVAKPEGISTPKGDASNSDTYDENSLYSSRAPDSTPEVGELEDSASSQNQNLSGGSSGANGPAETQSQFAKGAAAAAPLPRAPSPLPATRRVSGAVDLTAADNDDEEEEEGEYSPPEATEQFTNHGDPSLHTMVDPRTRPLRRYSEFDDNGKRPGSPSDNMRINTRTRNGRPNRGRAGSPRQSPDGPGQGLHPRKKRKLDKKSDKRKRNGGGSPDVKDEPVSPPPFHDVQPLGSGRQRPTADDRPIVIDDGPIREVRYMQAPEPYLSSPNRPISRQADPMMPLAEPRVVSRGGIRPVRDDTDLRRVASMHNMRAEQPREYPEQVYESPTRLRAASYARVDSPGRMEPPRLVQDMPQAYEREANQGLRVARTPAPIYRDAYQVGEPEVRYIPEPMPPPTIERIVVDQYGRRFREIVQDRSSVAPRAYSAFPDRGQPAYYENYDPGRGQSAMIESRQDSRMEQDPRMGQDPRMRQAQTGQEMPPPQVIRQIAEPGLGYREVYEPVPSQRSGSVRPLEQSPRQSIYLDERPEYRAPVRVGSVRPAGPRYEEMPPPGTARAGSVRPGAREGSVFVEDRSQVRREYLPVESPREYLPVEAPRYRVVEPEPRYIDAQGREIAYVDAGQDLAPRYVQRY